MEFDSEFRIFSTFREDSDRESSQLREICRSDYTATKMSLESKTRNLLFIDTVNSFIVEFTNLIHNGAKILYKAYENCVPFE